MFIYSNGCSHTFRDHENGYLSLIFKKIFKSSDTFKIIQSIEYLFGGKSEQIQHENVVDNLITTDNGIVSSAYDGKSNQIIFLESVEYINQCISKGKKPNHVIIQWTGPSRLIRMEPTEKSYLWVDCNPNDYIKHTMFEPMASITTLMYIYNMQTFLKSHNIDYTFLCYIELDSFVTKLDTFKLIDLDKFISYEKEHPITYGLRNAFLSKGWCDDEAGHPDLNAHIYMFDKIIQNIY